MCDIISKLNGIKTVQLDLSSCKVTSLMQQLKYIPLI